MEAEDTAADTSEILPPQGRQILAALPILLADDPEFEMYNLSAFDHHHHHHHVACPELDVAVRTSLLHACRFCARW